jgi:hypothetical protein
MTVYTARKMAKYILGLFSIFCTNKECSHYARACVCILKIVSSTMMYQVKLKRCYCSWFERASKLTTGAAMVSALIANARWLWRV